MSVNVDRTRAGFEHLATLMEALRLNLGDLTALNTVDKSSAVAAINEALSNSGAEIQDLLTNLINTWSSQKISDEIGTVSTAAGTAQAAADAAAATAATNAGNISTNTTNIGTNATDVAAAQADATSALTQVNAVLAGANASVDTFLEVFNEITANDGDIAGILTTLSQRVSTQAGQGLTGQQQIDARANINAADVVLYGADISAANYVADIDAIYNV